ncbi:hypothetical protein CUC00_11435 [Prevotella intermedia]|uniref:Uncharacterized protein n=1 Tax=Prevotella intermedia TaxID=28131 RepID=A0A2G8I6X5_PREIN|nr:hypothetical protein CTM44_10580 [Prevotella intermedia]ATV41706.1 hypothetical protein CUC00_11435 [Prevotella intermedia]PIK19253.1 hypothetical protein CTI18_09820 [Prevotella intermedia]
MHGKSGCFAMQNLRFRNAKTQLPFFLRIIFTRLRLFSCYFLEFLGILESLEILCEPAFTSLPKVQHPTP